MSPALSVVSDQPKPETVAQRVRRLQAEAKAASRDHVLTLVLAMSVAHEHARAIADGGEAYPAGIRDLARRFAEETEARALTLQAIHARIS